MAPPISIINRKWIIIGAVVLAIVIAVILYFIIKPRNECQSSTLSSTCQLDGDCNYPDGQCYKNSNGDCVCRCENGYSGKNCEIPPPTCHGGPCSDGKPCQNGGTCITSAGVCICQCINGYSGPNCENPPAQCGVGSTCVLGARNCGAHGNCIKGNNGKCTCVCKDGYTGTHCEYPPSPPPQCAIGSTCALNTNKCGEHGDCVKGSNGVCTCVCKDGYSGTYCKTAPSPSNFFTVKGPAGVSLTNVAINNSQTVNGKIVSRMCGIDKTMTSGSNIWCTDDYSTNPTQAQWYPVAGNLANVNVTSHVPFPIGVFDLVCGNTATTQYCGISNGSSPEWNSDFDYFGNIPYPNYMSASNNGDVCAVDSSGSSTKTNVLCQSQRKNGVMPYYYYNGQLNGQYDVITNNKNQIFCAIRKGFNNIVCQGTSSKSSPPSPWGTNIPISLPQNVDVNNISLDDNNRLYAITTTGQTIYTDDLGKPTQQWRPISNSKLKNISSNCVYQPGTVNCGNVGYICGVQTNGDIACNKM